MTEERYNEIDLMKPEELSQISEEEYKAYTRLNYLKRTDQKSALDDLLANVNTAQQGYLDIWPTGFSELDKKLDGGLMGEQLIFLGAISSLGKTSFALQIATQIAEQGKDVLIFSLEMSKNELNAKTISRYSYIFTEDDQSKQAYRLTTRDVLSGRVGGFVGKEATDEKGEVFIQALEATRKISEHTYICVGENDIDVETVRATIECHIRATGRRPFVILDYLQILQASQDADTHDKRLLTDYDVTRLKVISRDYHIPVLVISAFNRMSYLEPLSMSSFRESSGIEYSSDVLLGMQYYKMDYIKHWIATEEKKKDGSKKHKLVYESTQDHNNRIRSLFDRMNKWGASGMALPIELKILKNRNGSKGSLYYHFRPAYNYYEEEELSYMQSLYIEDGEAEPKENKKKSLGSV